jgi:hypothetical protein
MVAGEPTFTIRRGGTFRRSGANAAVSRSFAQSRAAPDRADLGTHPAISHGTSSPCSHGTSSSWTSTSAWVRVATSARPRTWSESAWVSAGRLAFGRRHLSAGHPRSADSAISPWVDPMAS